MTDFVRPDWESGDVPDPGRAVLPPPLPEWAEAASVPPAETPAESDFRSMRLAGYALFAYMMFFSASLFNQWAMSVCLAVIIALSYRATTARWNNPLCGVPLRSAIRAIGVQILLTVFIYCLVAALMGYVGYIAGHNPWLKYHLDYLNRVVMPFDISTLSFLNLALLIPFAEELFFRGYLLRRFRAMGSGFAVGLSSALFASLHMMGANQIFALLCGILWGRLSIRYGSLWPSIAAHVFTNALTFLVMRSRLDIPSETARIAAVYGGTAFVGPLAAAGCSLWLFVRMSKRIWAEIPRETKVVLEPGRTVKVIFHWPLSLILMSGAIGFLLSALFILLVPLFAVFFMNGIGD
jgi:membrane protease YdiL (CAAX protease family)